MRRLPYPVICGTLWLLATVIFSLTLGPIFIKPISNDNGYSESLKSLGFYLLGAGIAPLGLYLTYKRTQSLRMQTDTDTFTKSIELLGNHNPAVRQGGIYSLGRIARDNSKLHTTIMRIMASYIREKTCKEFNEKLEQERSQNNRDELIQELSEKPMPSDIEAAIEVIRERQISNDESLKGNEESFKLKFDLSNAYIFNAEFGDASFSKINFSDSKMIKCRFDRTNLSGSYFAKSDLQGSSFVNSILKDCEFIKTNFQKCDFEGCNLSGSKFKNCDLTDVKNLTQEQIDSIKVDRATKLPRASLNRWESWAIRLLLSLPLSGFPKAHQAPKEACSEVP